MPLTNGYLQFLNLAAFQKDQLNIITTEIGDCTLHIQHDPLMLAGQSSVRTLGRCVKPFSLPLSHLGWALNVQQSR